MRTQSFAFLRLNQWIICLFSMIAAGAVAAAENKIEFNRDIRPILADACFACHGIDGNARQADLRLDDRQSAIDSAAIEPGKPGQSEMIVRILTSDPDKVMPPPKSHKVLTAEQKELLQRWVVEGAEYQPHWSYVAPKKPELPAVADLAWVRNPIDRFVLQRLEAVGLKPAPEADLNTLARRAALDLTGLPPTPEMLAELRNDKSANAYERYVDRLLKLPEWGEHRGRYWLDYARYADTHGIHFDNYREMWAYRDWVIGAFNRNLPFDEFTIEQLAGDLLPNASLEQKIATGFNRCNITTNEGGVIPEEYVVLYARDRTETTASVFLGLTSGCAVCHDHKFDPLSMKEFYSLSAFFNNTTQNPMDGNIKDTPPIMPVPQIQDRDQVDETREVLGRQTAKLDELRNSLREPFGSWLKDPGLAHQLSWNAVPQDGVVAHLPLDEGAGDFLHVLAGGQLQRVAIAGAAKWESGYVASSAWVTSEKAQPVLPEIGDFDTDQAFSYGAWLYVPNNADGAVFARMDEDNDFRGWDLWLQKGRIGAHIVSKWKDDALKAVSKQALPANKWVHVMITYDGTSKIDGLKIYIDGKAQEKQVEAQTLKGSIRTKSPMVLGRRSKSSVTSGVRVQDIRLYSRALPPDEIDLLRIRPRVSYLAAKLAPKAKEEEAELFDYYLTNHSPDFQRLKVAADDSKRKLDELLARGTIAHVMQEKSGQDPMAYILFRGEYDKRRDPVKPATPKILHPYPAELPTNRLGLAKWLTLPDNPLYSRVTVNRFWQEVFGTGLVRTSGDFGVSGELPSHAELLDYLAIDFIESKYDVKDFFRKLVTSATYRQSSHTTLEKLEKDRDNRLLSRGPRFRMDAEMVRDYALAATGALVRKQGGASVRPYQPPGVWEAVAMIGSNTRDYREDKGENLYRRSMYTFWKRSAPPASMDIFNAPSRENCTVRRERTNTPLQALVTLNDPQFVEAARVLATMVLKQPGSSDSVRIDTITDRLICRELRPEEREVVMESLKVLRAKYAGNEEEAKKLLAFGETKVDDTLDRSELAAWTMLTNELMNLDEVLNK